MTNHLYLIRGASGSGKSTLTAKLGCPVVEADMLFKPMRVINMTHLVLSKPTIGVKTECGTC